MLKYFLLSTLLASTINMKAQEQERPELLTTPNGWRAEYFTFPISFAPSLTYVGAEDVRFSKGWNDQDAEDFFTYAFLWYLDEDPKLSVPKLNTDMKAYFDGLMSAVAGTKDLPKTTADFQGGIDNYSATIEVYDAFFSRDKLILNVTATASYCSKQKKYLVLFKLSPKEIDSEVWKKFDELEINVNCNRE